MNAGDEDQREEHKQTPNVPVSLDELKAFGVLYYRMDADNVETDPKLETLRKERGYTCSFCWIQELGWRFTGSVMDACRSRHHHGSQRHASQLRGEDQVVF